MEKKQAVIIGAGPAGLTAAYRLLKETDIHPIILEEESVVGGISKTVEYHGNRIDLGGHRFFSKNDEVMQLWKELMPLQGALAQDDILLKRSKRLSLDGGDPEKQDNVMLLRDRVSRIFYLRKFFDYPISLKVQTFKNMGLFRTIKAGLGYVWALIFKRKEVSLEDFYINHFGKPLYEMFFEDYTEKLWGIHPSNIAPDWGAQRVKGLSLLKAVKEMILSAFKQRNIEDKDVETSLIEEYMYPKYGPGQLWEVMADKIIELGGEIRLEAKVTKINMVEDNVRTIIFQDIKVQTYKEIGADYCISSMPIKDLIESMGQTVDEDVKKVATQLPYRDFITVGLLVNKLKIKNETKLKTVSDIVPDCWIYIQERDVKIGRLQIFNNWSPYMVKDLNNTVWIGLEYFCSEGDELWKKSKDEFVRFAIDELVKIDVIEVGDVLDSTCIKVKKAYPAYFGTYNEIDKVRAYLDEFKNLYCIGRNGQHRYNNMDHSMLTAMEAVRNIQNQDRSKSSIWQVNTEEEYHEAKQ